MSLYRTCGGDGSDLTTATLVHSSTSTYTAVEDGIYSCLAGCWGIDNTGGSRYANWSTTGTAILESTTIGGHTTKYNNCYGLGAGSTFICRLKAGDTISVSGSGIGGVSIWLLS